MPTEHDTYTPAPLHDRDRFAAIQREARAMRHADRAQAERIAESLREAATPPPAPRGLLARLFGREGAA